MSMEKRIQTLEQKVRPTRGQKIFTKCADGLFDPWIGDPPRHYGEVSADTSSTLVDRAHIEALERDGWDVIIVEYIEAWRTGES